MILFGVSKLESSLSLNALFHVLDLRMRIFSKKNTISKLFFILSSQNLEINFMFVLGNIQTSTKQNKTKI